MKLQASKTLLSPQDVIHKNLERSRFPLLLEGDGELFAFDIQDESMKSMGNLDLNSKMPTFNRNVDTTSSARKWLGECCSDGGLESRQQEASEKERLLEEPPSNHYHRKAQPRTGR